MARNNLAWLLATSSDASIRDGNRAIELAKQAVQLSGGKDADYLRTLAAAYAETGRFAEAARDCSTGIAGSPNPGELNPSQYDSG